MLAFSQRFLSGKSIEPIWDETCYEGKQTGQEEKKSNSLT